MGEFELLRTLVSLHVWGERLRGMTGAFIVQADSSAALGAALKLASPRPLMNALAAEISLVLERFSIERLLGDHYRGSINVEADALSRLWEGAKIPPLLELLRVWASPAAATISIVLGPQRGNGKVRTYVFTRNARYECLVSNSVRIIGLAPS